MQHSGPKRRKIGLVKASPQQLLGASQPTDFLTQHVHFPTTDGRELVFRRYTQPEKDQKILRAQLGWELPPQPPPRITAKGELVED
jgi:hypothetical protein